MQPYMSMQYPKNATFHTCHQHIHTTIVLMLKHFHIALSIAPTFVFQIKQNIFKFLVFYPIFSLLQSKQVVCLFVCFFLCAYFYYFILVM